MGALEGGGARHLVVAFFWLPVASAVHSVVSISPTTGPQGGATAITVAGSGFEEPAVTYCHFGNSAVPASVVDDFTLTCVSPALSAAEAETSMAVNFHFSTTGTVDTSIATAVPLFRYYTTPAITVIRPTSGRQAGGELIVIEGSGFDAVPEVAKCKFGDVVGEVHGIYNSNTRLVCRTPASSALGFVKVKLAMNGQNFAPCASPAIYFRYLEQAAPVGAGNSSESSSQASEDREPSTTLAPTTEDAAYANLPKSQLAYDHETGSGKITLVEQEGFEVGGRILINPGSKTEEENLIMAFATPVMKSSQLILESPTKHDHAYGEPVVQIEGADGGTASGEGGLPRPVEVASVVFVILCGVAGLLLLAGWARNRSLGYTGYNAIPGLENYTWQGSQGGYLNVNK